MDKYDQAKLGQLYIGVLDLLSYFGRFGLASDDMRKELGAMIADTTYENTEESNFLLSLETMIFEQLDQDTPPAQ